MAFFTKEELSTKNNTLLIITIVLILSFAMYIVITPLITTNFNLINIGCYKWSNYNAIIKLNFFIK